ncbi:MAG: leucyl-tRNA--protein transferase, partial [Treponema sp.]|nr:leucyl-tRNA--protein transferase [Treponema sp.]
MSLRYTMSDHVLITPQDDLETLLDELIATNYDKEFCLALNFSPSFIARLMAAGFLVMSAELADGILVLPKIHITRSILDFHDLHVKKSIRRLLSRYELRVDRDFSYIVDHCVMVHGDDWLTAPLVQSVKRICYLNGTPVRPISFGLYRDGVLVAGEFGVICGRVYTSYSGYYE